MCRILFIVMGRCFWYMIIELDFERWVRINQGNAQGEWLTDGNISSTRNMNCKTVCIVRHFLRCLLYCSKKEWCLFDFHLKRKSTKRLLEYFFLFKKIAWFSNCVLWKTLNRKVKKSILNFSTEDNGKREVFDYSFFASFFMLLSISVS